MALCVCQIKKGGIMDFLYNTWAIYIIAAGIITAIAIRWDLK